MNELSLLTRFMPQLQIKCLRFPKNVCEIRQIVYTFGVLICSKKYKLQLEISNVIRINGKQINIIKTDMSILFCVDFIH